jgi:hypothetical protein
MARRRFTRQEADGLLPYIAPLLVQLQGLKKEHERRQREVAELSRKMRTNGHVLEGRLKPAAEAMAKAVTAMNELIERVQSYGCEIKDLDMGLVDFRSLREGREVYLCWKLGEERVSFWHELDTGYTGRQALEEGA